MTRPESNGLPHVTDILARAGLIDTAWFTDEARDKGSALHLATQFLDEGDLDWQTVDPAVLPRLRQYQRFKDEVKPEIVEIEKSVINDALRYCGRYDRRVRIGGREGILDLKGPTQAPWHRLQTMLYSATFQRPMARWALYLSDERYKLIEFTGRDDWEACKAILTLTAWRTKHDPAFVQTVREAVHG